MNLLHNYRLLFVLSDNRKSAFFSAMNRISDVFTKLTSYQNVFDILRILTWCSQTCSGSSAPPWLRAWSRYAISRHHCCFSHRQCEEYFKVRAIITGKSPFSLSVHEGLRREIPCYTVFRFIATLNVPPQIAVINSSAISRLNRIIHCSVLDTLFTGQPVS